MLAHEEEMEVDKESCAEDDDIGIETDKSNEVNISKGAVFLFHMPFFIEFTCRKIDVRLRRLRA